MFRAPPTSNSNPTSISNNRNSHGNNSRNDSNSCDNSGMAWCSISSVSLLVLEACTVSESLVVEDLSAL